MVFRRFGRAAEGAVYNSVCIGFERWMKHTSRGSGPIVFLTGSKVGLGTPWRRIRDLFGPPLGLESCWGFAVSHASSTPCSRGPEVQANRGRSCHSLAVHCTVITFSSSGCRFACVAEALVLVFNSTVRRSGEAHRGVSPFWTCCRGCGNSVIGFERCQPRPRS